MRKLITICAVVGVVLAISSAAEASYVSVFNIGQADFSLTGFSTGGNPGVATGGPDYLTIDNVTGTYDLDIPPAGGSWDVYASGTVSLDFDKDGIWDSTETLDNEYLGNFPSPGPSTSWGPTNDIPITVTYDIYVLHFLASYDVDVDGDYPSGNFGPNAHANFSLSADPAYPADIYVLNTYLTCEDNASGGGDGIIDGWMTADIAVTCVPEPMTICLLGLGELLVRRKRKV
ncbi:MAG: hypothetical protein K8R02_01445 [Anaerohalosphaeraceae bacterium]|nr:hypothetical protein [Anaerohalosphaeraceae bacterium]